MSQRAVSIQSVQRMTDRPTFIVEDSDLPELRQAVRKLADLGYTEQGVRDRLGLADLADVHWRSIPIYRLERLSSRDRLSLAIDLFLLQGTLPADELDKLLLASERDALTQAGLLAFDEKGSVRTRASLFPVGDRLIFSDHAWPELPHPGLVDVPYDQVMAVGSDSRHLARCTLRRQFRHALDLCTGSGIHALLASAHAERVLAVDINPRATSCTRFNTRIQGLTNLEIAGGDLFAPARGSNFDLITANPPFVPSPLNTLGFRDGGRSGEDIQKRIFAGLPTHLAPGGIAQIVTELGERDGEPLIDRLREWLNGAPMDIHILRLSEHSMIKYATGHAKGDDYATYLESVHDWAGNLSAQGYSRVVSVVISLQWSDARFGPPWDRVDEAPPPRRDAGPEIEACFTAERVVRHPDFEQSVRQTWLRRAGAIALLDAHLLGSNVAPKAKATLLGQALAIEHTLDQTEREILVHLERRTLVQDLAVDEAAGIAAVRSLLRRRLVRLEI